MKQPKNRTLAEVQAAMVGAKHLDEVGQRLGGISRERARQILRAFGLEGFRKRHPRRQCSKCGQELSLVNKRELCPQCFHAQAWVDLVCPCGQPFRQERSAWKRQPQVYHSRKCWGKVAGFTFGWSKHRNQGTNKQEEAIMSVTAVDIVGIEEMPAYRGNLPASRPWANLLLTLEPNKATRLTINGPEKEAQRLIRYWSRDVKRHRPGYVGHTRIMPKEDGGYYVWLALKLRRTPDAN